jgi:hypothetical protein
VCGARGALAAPFRAGRVPFVLRKCAHAASSLLPPPPCRFLPAAPPARTAPCTLGMSHKRCGRKPEGGHAATPQKLKRQRANKAVHKSKEKSRSNKLAAQHAACEAQRVAEGAAREDAVAEAARTAG